MLEPVPAGVHQSLCGVIMKTAIQCGPGGTRRVPAVRRALLCCAGTKMMAFLMQNTMAGIFRYGPVCNADAYINMVRTTPHTRMI